jgi:hypothetical protein
VVHPIIPALFRSLRQENCEFEANLSYIVRCYLKKKPKNKTALPQTFYSVITLLKIQKSQELAEWLKRLSTCLATGKIWVQSPIPLKKKKKVFKIPEKSYALSHLGGEKSQRQSCKDSLKLNLGEVNIWIWYPPPIPELSIRERDQLTRGVGWS